jgi:tRNA dimethylallyltransferase
MGYPESLNSLNTVGYKEIISYFKGEFDLEKAVSLIKRNTRRYAKRQLTWFNADKRINWIAIGSEAELDSAAEIIISNIKQSRKD